jgi:hypothetical protein
VSIFLFLEIQIMPSLTLQEVADLGGNDSDLELLQGIDSDQEYDGPEKPSLPLDEDSILAELQELIGENKEEKYQLSKKKKEVAEPKPIVATKIVDKNEKVVEKKDKGAERIERDKKNKAARKEKPAVAAPPVVLDKTQPKKLLFEASENWHGIELPVLVPSAESGGRWEQVEIDRMYEKAKALYESQCAIHKGMFEFI